EGEQQRDAERPREEVAGDHVDVVLEPDEVVDVGPAQVVAVEAQPERVEDGVGDEREQEQDRRRVEQVGERGRRPGQARAEGGAPGRQSLGRAVSGQQSAISSRRRPARVPTADPPTAGGRPPIPSPHFLASQSFLSWMALLAEACSASRGVFCLRSACWMLAWRSMYQSVHHGFSSPSRAIARLFCLFIRSGSAMNFLVFSWTSGSLQGDL